MPRYMVEREFPEGLQIPINEEGEAVCGGVITRNAEDGVNWVHSYVSTDKKRSFCVYDGPSPEAIRTVAAKNGAPVGEITMPSSNRALTLPELPRISPASASAR